MYLFDILSESPSLTHTNNSFSLIL